MRREVAAGHQLHRDVSGILLHHGVQDRHDMRMAQLARERSFVEELLPVDGAELGIVEYFRFDRLQRDLAARERVLGEVHRARRAPAEQLADVVPADLKAQIHDFIQIYTLLPKLQVAGDRPCYSWPPYLKMPLPIGGPP
jgi:hypothetical protein